MSKRSASETAVALEYSGDGAPRVTAKGHGAVAEQILALARAHGIPIQENADLAGLLATIDLGEEIPAPLYRAVAEVLAFAYWLSGKPVPPRSEPGRASGVRA